MQTTSKSVRNERIKNYEGSMLIGSYGGCVIREELRRLKTSNIPRIIVHFTIKSDDKAGVSYGAEVYMFFQSQRYKLHANHCT